jgi:hypothetical protein
MKLPASATFPFLLIGLVVSGTAYSQVPSWEREALIELYNVTGGDKWSIKNGWKGVAGTECSWYGVTCSSGYVSRIMLHNNSLSGSIPSTLGSLKNLTVLYLNDNSLSGSIPPELGNLTNLTYFTLYTNSLSGNIPSELGNLTSLTYLSFHTNSLSGNIPSELGNLTNLTYFSFHTNSLSGNIPSEVGNLTNLTNLDLGNNSFSENIPSQLANLTNLTHLTLSNNSLSGSIPSGLGNLTNLTHLFLANNSFNGSIPAELGNLTNLIYLFLDNNSLSGSIPSELADLTNLSGLSLGDNFLTGPLPQWLSNMAIPYLNVTDAFNEWPSPYNGVTPDSSLGLAFNNIGVFSASDSIIYTCLRIFTDGLPGSAGGISEFDIGLTVVSLDEATVQITQYREFNTIGALNENVELPDCSGKFETTTSVYTDIIEAGDSVLDTTWSLIDPTNLILKLSSYQELTAN